MKTLQLPVLFAAAAILCFVVLARSASAHHGEVGAYVLDQTIKLQGVVKEVRWSNPHVIIAFDVKDSDGVESWAVELSSINTTESAGVKRNSLSPGDEIVVTGHSRRDTKLLILPRSIQKSDGTTAIPVPGRRFLEEASGR
jgi:hypothetical protein